jgi:hypothetical protein
MASAPVMMMSYKRDSYGQHGDVPMSTFALQTEATIEDYAEEEEDSPYQEVRVSVSNTDDPDMPVNTFRMWSIGLLLTIIGAGLNTFFIFRNPYRLIVSYAIL